MAVKSFRSGSFYEVDTTASYWNTTLPGRTSRFRWLRGRRVECLVVDLMGWGKFKGEGGQFWFLPPEAMSDADDTKPAIETLEPDFEKPANDICTCPMDRKNLFNGCKCGHHERAMRAKGYVYNSYLKYWRRPK